MKTTLFGTLALFAMVAMLGCDGNESTSTKKQPGMTLVSGALAPEITAKDTDGEVFNLSDYRGKIVMIDFWGDW